MLPRVIRILVPGTQGPPGIPGANGRTGLSSDTTFYVNASLGSNGNDGLSSGSPFATIQAALDAVLALDAKANAITISVAAGSYSVGGVAYGPLVGGNRDAPILIQGAGPATCHITSNNAACFRAIGGARLKVTGFSLSTTSAGACLSASLAGQLVFGDIEFGACAAEHMVAASGGIVTNVSGTNYTISGSAVSHRHVTTMGYMLVQNATVALSGTPDFSQYFAGVNGGYLQEQGVTYSGSATGRRFSTHMNSQIFVTDAVDTETYFPGDVAGDAYGGGTFNDISKLLAIVDDATTGPARVDNTRDASSVEIFRFRGMRPTPANNDIAYNSHGLNNAAATLVNAARHSWQLTVNTAGAEMGAFVWGVLVSGVMTNELFLGRGAAGCVLRPITDAAVDFGATASRFGAAYISSFIEMSERTQPSAPGADKVRLYTQDNGAGKTRLMALFPTGAAQQVAIEP